MCVIVCVCAPPLTDFIQLAQVNLLPLAVGQVCVQRGAHQSEPAHPGRLQVQTVFTLQPADPLKVKAEEGLGRRRDEALQTETSSSSLSSPLATVQTFSVTGTLPVTLAMDLTQALWLSGSSVPNR